MEAGETALWTQRAAELGLDSRRTLDQRIAIYVSTRWEESGSDFNIADFHIADLGQFRVRVETYELPDAIAADALMDHIATPTMPDDPALYRRAVLATQRFARETRAPDGNRTLAWTRAQVMGDHLRIADFALQFFSDAWEAPQAAATISQIEWIVETATFAAELTPVDLIAPNSLMKQSSVDNVMRFRVPVGWTRSRQKDWTLYDPGDPKLGVFEANWDLWTSPTAPEQMTEIEAMMMHLKVYEKFSELLGAADWAIIQDTDHDKSPPERWVTFRKLYSEPNRLLVLSFRYRVAESIADTPEVRAIDQMFEREIRASVARFPRVGVKKPRARRAGAREP